MKYLALLIPLLLVGCNQDRSTQVAPAASTQTPAPAAAPVVAVAPSTAPTTAPVQALSIDEFKKARQEHPAYVLLDVRTPEEFAAGHLEGAELINFRAPDFDSKIAGLDHSKTYLVYCRTGHRSGLACQKFAALNIPAYNLTGGITAWQQAGLPVQK